MSKKPPAPAAPLPSRPRDGDCEAKGGGEVTGFYQPAAASARGAGAAAAGLCDSGPRSKGGSGASERHPNNCRLILARLCFGIYYSLSRQIPIVMGSFIKRLALSPAVGGKKSVIAELFAVVEGARGGADGGGRAEKRGAAWRGEAGEEGADLRAAGENPGDLRMSKNLVCILPCLLSLGIQKRKAWKFNRQLWNKQYSIFRGVIVLYKRKYRLPGFIQRCQKCYT